MQVTIENKELVIRIPLENPPRPSSSGKTLIVASSGGGKKSTAKVDGNPITVNLSAWIQP